MQAKCSSKWSPGRKELLPEKEGGFPSSLSTTDMMFVVRRLQELGRKAEVPLFLCSIDILKAYDSVDRNLLWHVLFRLGVPPQMITVIREFHDGMKACVRSSDVTCSKLFEVNQGLRQGCVIYLILQRFGEDADILEEQPRQTIPESSIECVRRAVWGMLYADDACILSRSSRALVNLMGVIVHFCDAFNSIV